MAQGLGFKRFLHERRKDQNAVGDFARDWLTDPGAPPGRSLEVVLDHLAWMRACPDAETAGREAWALYKDWRKARIRERGALALRELERALEEEAR